MLDVTITVSPIQSTAGKHHVTVIYTKFSRIPHHALNITDAVLPGCLQSHRLAALPSVR